LKEKHPDAGTCVELHHDRQKGPLSEAGFREIISLLDWSKEGDDEAITEPAVSRLAAGSVRHIIEFADMLSEKLYALDGLDYASHIGEGSWSPDQYFSVDHFLYARCCVIANGAGIFEEVLKNPDKMPGDCTFEALLYIPSEAYQRKTGRKYAYTPAFSFETFSNQAGWASL
jgi:hypothetical protein